MAKTPLTAGGIAIVKSKQTGTNKQGKAYTKIELSFDDFRQMYFNLPDDIYFACPEAGQEVKVSGVFEKDSDNNPIFEIKSFGGK